jgi:uncharacterized metal-binding protein YceD (DUF177 family)
MRIAIEAIPTQGRDVAFSAADAWALSASTVAMESPVTALSGALHLEREGPVVGVSGHIEARAPRTCGRCASRFDLELSVDVDLEYAPEDTDDTHERELAGDELDLGFYAGEHLEIGAVVSEALALELPPNPSCPDVEACDARTADLLARQSTALQGHPGFSVLRNFSQS